MKTIPALLFAAVVAVGLLGGAAAYQVASGPVGTSPSATTSTDAAPVVERTRHVRPKVRWAACKPPAVRQGKACVTEEIRTVVVPAPPAPAPATRPVRTGGGHAESEYEHESESERGDDGRHAEPAEHEIEHENDNNGNDGNDIGGNGNNGGEHDDD